VTRSGTALLCHGAKINRTLSGAGLNSCDLAQRRDRRLLLAAESTRVADQFDEAPQRTALHSCLHARTPTHDGLRSAKPHRLFKTGSRLGTSDAATVGRFQLGGPAFRLDMVHLLFDRCIIACFG
jgi:hypothetical protein